MCDKTGDQSPASRDSGRLRPRDLSPDTPNPAASAGPVDVYREVGRPADAERVARAADRMRHPYEQWNAARKDRAGKEEIARFLRRRAGVLTEQ